MDTIRQFEALKRQKEMQWDTPIPFFDYQLPEFPLDALPSLFQDYAEAIAEQMQMLPDMPALELLAAVSTACAGKVDIEPYDGWREPIQTYTMVCMGVGERKSAVLKLAYDPLVRWQADKAKELAGDIAASQSRKRLLQKQQQKAEDKGNEAAAEEYARKLAEFEEVTAPRILADDITPEALASIMAANHGIASIWSSEGGLLSILGGRYQNKDAGPNIDLILKAYSSDMAAVDRVGRSTEIIRSPALTIMLAVQPDVLEQLMSNPAFMNRGLCGRFMYSQPESLVGRRKIHSRPVPEGLKAEYSRIIRYLLDMPYPEERHVLRLDAEALRLFDQWGEEIEPKLADEWKNIGGWANKLQGLTLRLAGQIHMIRCRSWDVSIDARAMEAAIRLGRYAVSHALAAFGLSTADAEAVLAKKMLMVFREQRMVDFRKRELMRAIRGPKGKDFDQSLALLEEYGYICKDLLERESEAGKGRPAGMRWIINPAWTEGG